MTVKFGTSARNPRIVFNSINTRSAGTRAVTNRLIRQLKDHKSKRTSEFVFFVSEHQGVGHSHRCDNVTVNVVTLGSGILAMARRLWFEFVTFPRFIRHTVPSHAVVLGNYSFRKLPCAKSVLVRHPYLLLLTEKNIRDLPLKRKFEEYVRTLLFKITCKLTDSWIVQSSVMKEALQRRWNISEGQIAVMPNPVDDELLTARSTKRQKRESTEGEWKLIYPSRWYEHKNHDKLVEFAAAEREFLVRNNMQILLTVTQVPGSAKFLQTLEDSGLSDQVIVNLGEVEQDELYRWYKKSDAVLFPSESETFGNGLIEGACFSLPLLVADRPYAHAFDVSKMILFEPSDISSIRHAIEELMSNYAASVAATRCIAELAIESHAWVGQLEHYTSRTGSTSGGI